MQGGALPISPARMTGLQHTPKADSPYIYAYFILVKILQPFSQPFILFDFQK